MLEKLAYEILLETTPMLVSTIKVLLELGQTPNKIAARAAERDVFLAGLVEMAAVHIQEAEEQGDGHKT